MKTKKITDGQYEIVGTDLLVIRGLPPRYRHPQEWYVVAKDDTDGILIIGHGKSHAVEKLELLLAACGAAVPA